MPKANFPKMQKNPRTGRCPKCVKGNCHQCTGVNCDCRLCGGTKPRSVG